MSRPSRNDRSQRRRRLVLAGGLGALAALALPGAAQATGLIAAYERYEAGKGFEIKLVNPVTGQQLAVPASVNTTADEYHPALSPDGRFLVFTRATLLPQLDGDVVPPADRVIRVVDRESGSLTSQPFGLAFGATNQGAGATVSPSSGGPALAYGTRLDPAANGTLTRPIVGARLSGGFTFSDPLSLNGNNFSAAGSGSFRDFPHVSAQLRQGLRLHGISNFGFSAADGSVTSGITRLRQQTLNSAGEVVDVDQLQLGGGGGTVVNHAVLRADGYVALDSSAAAGVDVRTIQFPGESQPANAPAPITTPDAERLPAWSPDGVRLAFVRTPAGGTQRSLLVFDATAGIQTILNPGVALGAEAPTPQLRAFQNVWGGLSLANSSQLDSPVLSCASLCLASISGASALTLAPTVAARSVVGTSVGILIARVTGTRRVLGRTVPRISVVGRVPLGAAKKGKNGFAWNGRVNGRRLPRGSYLLTFRSLNRRGRILSTSQSVRFSVTAAGRITGARIQR